MKNRQRLKREAAMNLSPRTCCFFTLLTYASVLSEPEKYTLNARSGHKIAINCSATASRKPLLTTWKITTQNINYCILSFRTDTETTFTNCSGHLGWNPGSENSSDLLINPVELKDDGIYICDTSNVNGNYISYNTLNVQVPPTVTLTSDGSSSAVCRASGGKPAANISWHPTCENCITEQQVHPDKTVTVVSTYRAMSDNETLIMCVVSHPTFLEPQNSSIVKVHRTAGMWSPFGLQTALYIWLPIVLCFIIVSSILGFLLYRRPQELRLKRLSLMPATCKK
ncbi:cell surface glycoprotein CD200 receptor 2-like isoform X2 [Pleurodeles waltl]|uniref:cell surface glycoprotein CD200 receptor 2-like isoform X2 n=1 Tax=Pleurodeles waltl TaxID=8319 RepID=UPI0037093C96